jgi:TolB-like protein
VAIAIVLCAGVIALWITSGTESEPQTDEVVIAPVVPDPPQGPTIAVLPFMIQASSNIVPSLATNLGEQVTKNLAAAETLHLAPKESVSAFSEGVRPSVGEISYALGVRYVFQAMIDGEGNDVRVDARLDDGMTGDTVWTGSFWAERLTLFELHAQIADAILNELGLRPAAP